jgi:hypothetical protein
MSEMIEEVAQALAIYEKPDIQWLKCGKNYYLEMARVAIEAMREPTLGMLEAAAPFPSHLNYGVINRAEMEAATAADQLTIHSHWLAMIDAALKEDGQ